MAETLSQEEIDALKQAVHSGADLGAGDAAVDKIDKVKIVRYDFRKPRMISTEDFHVIQLIHEEMSKSMETFLVSKTKASVDVKLSAIDQMTYGEFVMTMAAPVYVLKVGAGRFGVVSVEIGMPVTFALIDTMLGGKGDAANAAARELTVLECTVLENVSIGLIEGIKNAWFVAGPMNMELQEVVSNPEYLQAASPEAPCLNIAYNVRVASASSVISICYPVSVIQAAFRMKAEKSGGQPKPSAGTGMLKAMGCVPLSVRAVLGKVVIIAEDLGRLKAGDLILMDRRIDDPVDVLLDKVEMFSGHIGKKKDKMAVEILGYKRKD